MAGIMPEHTPTSVVGQLNSYMFSFRNPFNTALRYANSNIDLIWHASLP